MACFTAPAALGVATFIFRKKFPAKWHIDWLNTMIFGGTLALGVEHVAHGEIVPWPPFITAMSNPADAGAMFGEIAAVGIPMAAALVLVWIAMVVVYERVIISGSMPTETSGS